ncbi:MAG: ABC transporter ATP-binding protein [Dehalococcoidia bacterium]|nr:ABC transporter ATP-binding protein [Dehalococcoidia bacterium]
MFRIEGAEFFYDNTHTGGFKEVSFSIKPGQVLCILGPNGCGKTTLLKCLAGIFKLQKGRLWLNDSEVKTLKDGNLARAIGYVPQLHQPAFPFSVLDAVLVGRAPHLGFLESPKKKDYEIAETAIEALGITHLAQRPYTEISGGERQLVVFARVMTQQPSLLLLDEPTSHLDFGNQIRVLRLVEELAAAGLPVIMTSHFPDHAFLVGSKVAIMKKGEFLAFGPPDEVITDQNLETIYGSKVKVMEVNGQTGYRACVPVKSDLDCICSKKSLLDKLYSPLPQQP